MRKINLNKQNQISAKSDEFKQLVQRLKLVISKLPKEQQENKNILHSALKQEGWTEKEIALLNKAKMKTKHSKGKRLSPFEAFRKKTLINPNPLQGGAPSLGKGKP